MFRHVFIYSRLNEAITNSLSNSKIHAQKERYENLRYYSINLNIKNVFSL